MIISLIEEEHPQAIAVLLLQLEVPMDTVHEAAAVAGGRVVLTPAPRLPLSEELLALVDVLVPNEHELVQLTGAPPGERTPAELVALVVARSASPRSVCRNISSSSLMSSTATPATAM